MNTTASNTPDIRSLSPNMAQMSIVRTYIESLYVRLQTQKTIFLYHENEFMSKHKNIFLHLWICTQNRSRFSILLPKKKRIVQ